MATHWVPEGHQQLIPYLVVRDVQSLLDFVQAAFAAEITERVQRGDGAVMHAQVRIGDCVLMMGEAPEGADLQFVSLYLYVPDVDVVYARALAAGGESHCPVATQFYGDRHGGVKDSAGNIWWIATHVEDVGGEELARRAREARS